MNLQNLITSDRVRCESEVSSKKRALELAGDMIAEGHDTLSANDVFDSLIGREQLGSTGLGHGVALPHGRLGEADQTICAFIKLANGVDFDATDQQPVDLVFAMLVPEHFTDEHLKILAQLAEMFSDPEFCDRLREAETDQSLYDTLLQWQPSATPF